MRMPNRLGSAAVLVAIAVAVAAVPASAAKRPTRAQLIKKAKVHRLKSYPTCEPFRTRIVDRLLPEIGPYGLGGNPAVLRLGVPVAAQAEAAPVAGVDYSPTNVQEAGVDEPDIVKSDGRTLFTVADGKLRAVALRGAASTVTGSLTFDEAFAPQSMLLDSDRLLVVGNASFPVDPAGGRLAPGVAPTFFRFREQVTLIEVNVANPKAMQVVSTMTIDDARFVDARLTGASARVVISSNLVPRGVTFTTPDQAGGEAAATAANRALVSATTAEQWLPRADITRQGATTTRPLLDCAAIRFPARDSGAGLISILTVDLRQGLETPDADAIVSDGDVVYASTDSMYVATTRWFEPAGRPAKPAIGPNTVIHKFDTRDPTKTRYRGSGSVPGFLNNQWSMSEFRGRLRVASTDLPPWAPTGPGRSQSFVSVLQEAGGTLIPVGRVGGIGEGESVYAVRFIGDTGYVVTFRQTDPLHVIDLSTPTAPRVAGELVIPGYSSYLHPIGSDLLLGVGQDADAGGRITGSQVSVFDVSDPRAPRRVSHRSLGRAWSEAEWNHRAFLYWPATGLTMLPLSGELQTVAGSDGGWFQGAVGLRVLGRSPIVEIARPEHPNRAGASSAIQRAMVASGSVYTVSGAGVMVSDLATLATRAWVPYPAP